MQAVIDRFEGDIAVMLCGEEQILLNLPRKYLPAGAQEGMILTLRFTLEPEQTGQVLEQARARIERLRRLSRPE